MLAEATTVWKFSPALYFLDRLKVRPTNQQMEALEWLGRLVVSKSKRAGGLKTTPEEQNLAKKVGISIHSGHGLGKDMFLAAVTLWWLECWESSEGRMTAPTAHQLQDVLWKEIRLLHRKADLSEVIEIQSDSLFRVGFKGEWFISARTSNARLSAEEQAETLAGAHRRYLLMGVDEASGVPDGVFLPLEGAMTGAVNIAILIGNPTRANGYFADSHGRDRDYWICLRWSCEDSDIDQVVAGNQSQAFVERSERKYGRNSNYFRVRVQGLTPNADPDTLIPYEWIMDAVNRPLEAFDNTPHCVGIDVGAGRDKSIVVIRHGPIVLPLVEFSETRSEYLARRIDAAISPYDPVAVAVDTVGIGWGIAGELRTCGYHRPGEGKRVIDFKGSHSAFDSQRFRNRRDELYWTLREMFELGTISIPDDDELIGQLSSIRTRPLGAGQKEAVETKQEMRARGLSSPDRADALCIAFAIHDRYALGKTRPDPDAEDFRRYASGSHRAHSEGWMQ